jgi:hypothetical protein
MVNCQATKHPYSESILTVPPSSRVELLVILALRMVLVRIRIDEGLRERLSLARVQPCPWPPKFYGT